MGDIAFWVEAGRWQQAHERRVLALMEPILYQGRQMSPKEFASMQADYWQFQQKLWKPSRLPFWLVYGMAKLRMWLWRKRHA